MIDPIGGTWDEALVCDLFWEDHGKMILRIPFHDGMEDIVSRHYNKNRLFSVRSAYKVCVEDRGEMIGDKQDHPQLWQMVMIACCGSTSGS